MTKIIFHTMSNVTVNKANKKQLNTLRRIAISLMHIPVHDNHNQQGYKATRLVVSTIQNHTLSTLAKGNFTFMP